ncbi:hypothetical protein [Symbioplanes lichenis]|uniref:hypothetical protein n=1 Tax=Symbioplanes lichenis TaxID=1629072 RepID=UPI0027387591|nr:hypothetical protein [Actinoplanes lichenis]
MTTSSPGDSAHAQQLILSQRVATSQHREDAREADRFRAVEIQRSIAAQHAASGR